MLELLVEEQISAKPGSVIRLPVLFLNELSVKCIPQVSSRPIAQPVGPLLGVLRRIIDRFFRKTTRLLHF